MTIKERIKRVFTGPGVENPLLKRTFFSQIILTTAVIAVCFFIFGLIFRKHLNFTLATGSMVIFMGLLLIGYQRKQDRIMHGAIYIIYCIVTGCVYVPVLYIYGGGLQSGVPLFFILAGIATILLLDNWLMFLVLIANIASAFITYQIDQKNYLADEYLPAATHTYLDIALSVIIVGWAAGMFLKTLTKGFEEKEAKVNELYNKLEDAATKDPLSGAYNRRFLMDYLNKCIQQVEDGDMKTFSIIMFDIDHFKRINDTYGHLAGDDCIRNLSLIIQNTTRKTDITTRYGGEEFICVLPTAEDTPAFRRAEQIRVAVENTQLSEDIDKTITVSGGVMMYKPGMTPEELIESADHNLYLAKESGRNQIVWHDGGIPPLVYSAYDGDALKPTFNSGRRFSDATKF
ncbi:MAG: GGDEF domain-containing protein [Clostridia bacterium]|nr:GGDEF domain-containing protein [Clostridia bacterium]